MSGKDEKPATPGSEASEQPQKTKAELKAERRAVQVRGCFCLVLFCFFHLIDFVLFVFYVVCGVFARDWYLTLISIIKWLPYFSIPLRLLRAACTLYIVYNCCYLLLKLSLLLLLLSSLEYCPVVL